MSMGWIDEYSKYKIKVVRDLAWVFSSPSMVEKFENEEFKDSAKCLEFVSERHLGRLVVDSSAWLLGLDKDPVHLIQYVKQNMQGLALGSYFAVLVDYWLKFCPKIKCRVEKDYRVECQLTQHTLGQLKWVFASPFEKTKRADKKILHWEGSVKFFALVESDALQTPSHLHRRLWKMCLSPSKDTTEHVVEFLRKATTEHTSFNVNARNPTNGKTALMLAAWRGHFDTVRVLLDCGADINLYSKSPGSYGKSAIFFAATRCRDAVVRLLLRRGAHVCICNNKGQTPRSLAATHLKIETQQAIREKEKRELDDDEHSWFDFTKFSDGKQYGDLDPRFGPGMRAKKRRAEKENKTHDGVDGDVAMFDDVIEGTTFESRRQRRKSYLYDRKVSCKKEETTSRWQSSFRVFVGPYGGESLAERINLAAQKLFLARQVSPFTKHMFRAADAAFQYILKGYLFYPLAHFGGSRICPRGLSRHHLAGWHVSDPGIFRDGGSALACFAEKIFPSSGRRVLTRFVILSKLNWLSPVRAVTGPRERARYEDTAVIEFPRRDPVPPSSSDAVSNRGVPIYRSNVTKLSLIQLGEDDLLSGERIYLKLRHLTRSALVAQLCACVDRSVTDDCTLCDRSIEWREVSRGFVLPDQWCRDATNRVSRRGIKLVSPAQFASAICVQDKDPTRRSACAKMPHGGLAFNGLESTEEGPRIETTEDLLLVSREIESAQRFENLQASTRASLVDFCFREGSGSLLLKHISRIAGSDDAKTNAHLLVTCIFKAGASCKRTRHDGDRCVPFVAASESDCVRLGQMIRKTIIEWATSSADVKKCPKIPSLRILYRLLALFRIESPECELNGPHTEKFLKWKSKLCSPCEWRRALGLSSPRFVRDVVTILLYAYSKNEISAIASPDFVKSMIMNEKKSAAMTAVDYSSLDRTKRAVEILRLLDRDTSIGRDVVKTYLSFPWSSDAEFRAAKRLLRTAGLSFDPDDEDDDVVVTSALEARAVRGTMSVTKERTARRDGRCLENVVLVSDTKSLQESFNRIRNETKLGSDVVTFDAEWQPGSNRVELVQLAVGCCVFVIDIRTIQTDAGGRHLLVSFLDHLFINCVMVGWAIRNDLENIWLSISMSSELRVCERVCDLQWLIQTRDTKKELSSLSTVCANILGLSLCKAKQLSNWSQRPLEKAQIEYAALDAWALRRLVDELDFAAERSCPTTRWTCAIPMPLKEEDVRSVLTKCEAGRAARFASLKDVRENKDMVLVKTIAMVVGKKLVVCVVDVRRKIRMGAVAKLLHAKPRFATLRELVTLFGYRPGSLGPFALRCGQSAEVLLDANICSDNDRKNPVLLCGSGSPGRVFSMLFSDVRVQTSARVCPLSS